MNNAAQHMTLTWHTSLTGRMGFLRICGDVDLTDADDLRLAAGPDRIAALNLADDC